MIGVPSITRFVKFIRLGEAAVRYYLTSSAKSIAVDADGNAVSPDETISIRVMKQVGSSSPVKNYDCSFTCYTVKDGVETNFGSSKFSGNFSFSAKMINGEDAIRAKLFSTAGDVIDTLDIIASKKGDKGDRGAALRGPQAWADIANGYVFQAGGDNDEWKDVVLYNGNYYSCLKGHTKTASNYPTSTEDTNNGYWKLGDKVELIATNILLSTYALVKNLGVEAIEMRDDKNNIVFYAKGGEVTCNKGTFKNIKVIGSIRNPFSLANDSIDTNYSDNVAMLTNDGGWLTSYSMPWDVSQSGRRLSIVNYKWGSTLASGKAVINAPSGQYFFEDGIQKNSLKVSREIIELIGYGTTTEFYGWIVLNRIDLATSQKYGHCLKALAVGTVSGGDSNNNTSITSSTFDGSKLTVSRQSQGLYRVYYPSAWFSDLNYCHVMLTGRGVCYKDKSPVKATLHSLGNGYFDVTVSDDATRNDGSFDFIIYNGSDFDILK